jgi:hypothetical protein
MGIGSVEANHTKPPFHLLPSNSRFGRPTTRLLISPAAAADAI